MLKAGRILLTWCLLLWTCAGAWAITNPESRCSRVAAGAISNARYYDPVLARFIQPDDIIPVLFNPQSYNRYSYVLNNPLRYTDPSGHEPYRYQITTYQGGLLPAGTMDYIGGTTTGEKIIAGTLNVIPFMGNGLQTISRRMEQDKQNIAQTISQKTGLQADAVKKGLDVFEMGVMAGDNVAKGPSILENGIRGRASEAKVLKEMGLVKNTEKVSTAGGNAIPDALTSKISLEVKDTKVVNRTKQIGIETDAAKASGQQSVLVTGSKTQISGPAQKSFDTIIKRPDLGPQK